MSSALLEVTGMTEDVGLRWMGSWEGEEPLLTKEEPGQGRGRHERDGAGKEALENVGFPLPKQFPRLRSS